MQEVDVVLLDQRKLPTVLKDIAVFKAGFHTEEELLLGGSELRPQTEAEHTVLVTYQQMQISSATLQPDMELNTLNLPNKSRTNCVTRLSAVMGRFITISMMRKI